MAAFTPLLLIAAAAAQPAYPVDDVLNAFRDVCFANTDQGFGDAAPVFAAWKIAAEQHGWTEVGPASSIASASQLGEKRDQTVRLAFDAIDNAFMASIAGSQWADVAEHGLFKKQVAGRSVYLSAMAAQNGGTTLTECRLHDPLGDGIRTSPISEETLERWSGAEVRRQKGVYGGKAYAWNDPGKGDRSIRVHFGFDGYPIPRWGEKFEPYKMYGLTLVASDYSQIIVT